MFLPLTADGDYVLPGFNNGDIRVGQVYIENVIVDLQVDTVGWAKALGKHADSTSPRLRPGDSYGSL